MIGKQITQNTMTALYYKLSIAYPSQSNQIYTLNDNHLKTAFQYALNPVTSIDNQTNIGT